jgi:hypothetical protein
VEKEQVDAEKRAEEEKGNVMLAVSNVVTDVAAILPGFIHKGALSVWRRPLVPSLQRIVQTHWFEQLVLFLILLNTIIMCCDRYPQTEAEITALNVLNYVFNAAFSVELVLKLLALGWRHALRSGQFQLVRRIANTVHLGGVFSGGAGPRQLEHRCIHGAQVPAAAASVQSAAAVPQAAVRVPYGHADAQPNLGFCASLRCVSHRHGLDRPAAARTPHALLVHRRLCSAPRRKFNRQPVRGPAN